MLSAKFVRVPIRKTYTADLEAFDYLDPGKKQLLIPMHYVLTNDEANGMGEFPLQRGKVRIFQDDGRGTQAFLGEDWGGFTPRDDEMKLFLGQSKDGQEDVSHVDSSKRFAGITSTVIENGSKLVTPEFLGLLHKHTLVAPSCQKVVLDIEFIAPLQS